MTTPHTPAPSPDPLGKNSDAPSVGGGTVGGKLGSILARLSELRGTPQQWLEKDMQVLHFIAGLHDTTRVFCRGEVRLPTCHAPAVLTHNSIYRQTFAWSPTGRKGAMEPHSESSFWSNVPHVAIAREVLFDKDTTCAGQS